MSEMPAGDKEADYTKTQQGLTLSDARDVTAFRWLLHGQTKALAAFLEAGHIPRAWLLKYVAKMLGSPGPLRLTNGKELPVRYRLESRAIDGKRRADPATLVKDYEIAMRFVPGEKYDAEVARIAAQLGISKGQVRGAYDKVLHAKK